jgi:hypothetical protein
MARALPEITWQPTDADPDALASIAAWVAEANLPNLRPPLLLDVTREWPVARADAVVCINLIHISPWSATRALFAGASRLLDGAGVLYTYGPYRTWGSFRAPSNQSFDADLRRRNPAWGVRDVEELEREAKVHGLDFAEIIPMPANNFSLIFAPCAPGRPLAWHVRRARQKLGAQLQPILELELELGNEVRWQGHGWGSGEGGRFHVDLRDPLHFAKIEKRLHLPEGVRRTTCTDPHYPQTDGYWDDHSDTGIEGPLER